MARSKPNLDESPSFGSRPFEALAGLRADLPQAKPVVPSRPAGTATASSDAAPALPKLVVRREKKGHGGKVVTVVQGLPGKTAEDIASRLKRALGTGARVEGGEVVVQGDLVERVAVALEGMGASKVVRGN